MESSREADQPERISGFPKSYDWNLDEAIVETKGKGRRVIILMLDFIHYFYRQDYADELSV